MLNFYTFFFIPCKYFIESKTTAFSIGSHGIHIPVSEMYWQPENRPCFVKISKVNVTLRLDELVNQRQPNSQVLPIYS